MDLRLVSQYRGVIYGFSIIYIVLFHGVAIDKGNYSFGMSGLQWLQDFIAMGNIGVDIFLLLSGICLYFSFQKNDETYAFIKKRLARVVPSAYIVYSLYWVVKYLFLSFNPTALLGRLTLMDFWIQGDTTMWFLSLILVLYFCYPYFYGFLFHGKSPALRCALLMGASYLMLFVLFNLAPDYFKMTEVALTRFPVFILGCFMGKYVYEDVRMPSLPYIPLAFVLFFGVLALNTFGHLPGYVMHMVYLIGGVGGAYSIALICLFFDKHLQLPVRPLYRFFDFTGGFTLELYFCSIMINQVLRMTPFYQVGNLAQYLLLMAVAYVLAWLVGIASTAIANRLLGKTKKLQALHAGQRVRS